MNLVCEMPLSHVSRIGIKISPSVKTSFWQLLDYIRPHRKLIFQLILGMLTGSVLLLILPFLSQAVVDKGIETQNFGFIQLVLIAQFQQMSANQSSIIELIQGMPEIKLQGSERKRRNAWKTVQVKLFHISLKSLSLSQMQDAGAGVINQSKDIFITFLAAKAVIDGQMTLGMMLATQYIVGQLNAPLQQFVAFIRTAQDAKISMERLAEIYDEPNEDEIGNGQSLISSAHLSLGKSLYPKFGVPNKLSTTVMNF